MRPRYMDYPSPRGVHVPETHVVDEGDPYHRDSVYSPRRNRYSRSVHQTPRIRDVTWMSSPDPTPQTLHAPPSPFLPPPQVPSSPVYRPPSAVPPSPAPTVGEHMAVDDVIFTQDDIIDPYAYQPERRGSVGFFGSIWKGLKKLSGFQPTPYVPRAGSYDSQTMEVPAPVLSTPSETTRSGNPTPPGTDERHGAASYVSPYVQSTAPVVMPSPLRASPVTPIGMPPPITIISPSTSPSTSPSPLSNSVRSARMPSPVMSAPRSILARGPEPPVEEGSQTLHEPVPGPSRPALPLVLASPPEQPEFPTRNGAIDSPTSTRGSLSSPVTRFRRFVSKLDGLPWVADNQIANEYVPERTPRSQMRRRVRQGTEPLWYTARPEVVERPENWAEWDGWAKQSTMALWDGVNGEGRGVGWGNGGGPGGWRTMYPHGYVLPQPGFAYPSGYPPPWMAREQAHASVLP